MVDIDENLKSKNTNLTEKYLKRKRTEIYITKDSLTSKEKIQF